MLATEPQAQARAAPARHRRVCSITAAGAWRRPRRRAALAAASLAAAPWGGCCLAARPAPPPLSPRRSAITLQATKSNGSSSSSGGSGNASENEAASDGGAFGDDWGREAPAAAGGGSGDKWEDALSVHHTLSSLYTPKVDLQPFKQIDHAAKRREREMREIAEAGRKLGLSEASLRENAASLEALVPGLAPNLDRMKASQWAKLLSDTSGVVAVVIALRTAFPGADLAAMIARQPRLLLRKPREVAEDAAKVRALLAPCPDVDSILQEVPDLLDPRELGQALANLRRCFPQEDPFALLQANPSILRNIGGEVDIEAEPTYGEITTAG